MALLISQGVNIIASSHVVGPVLTAAILSGNKDAVKKIMDSDVRFDLDYTKCDAPLSLSARISEPPLFQSILESGRGKWLMNAKLLDQALVEASEWGRLESTRILLGFPHVYTNSTLEQAVSIAATKGQWLCVKELLEFIARETGQNKRRDVKLDDAFYLAAICRENRVDILESIWYLTNQRIAQDVRDFSLYLTTVMKKDTTAVWLLETCKADANAVAEKPSSGIADAVGGVTMAEYSNALNAAASSGNRTLVSSLLDQGAQIDGDHGYSLQLAASEGHVDVVDLLLEHGALVNKHVDSNEDVGFFSGTALQAACENSRVETVRTLINHGADPNLGGGALSYPITAATQKSQLEILTVLLDAPGIDGNVRGGEEHYTPLINAAAHISADAVKLLLMKGADVNAQTSGGDTALIMAAARGDPALACNCFARVELMSHTGILSVASQCKLLLKHCIRQTGKSDASLAKQRLDSFHATLSQRDAEIDTLRERLEETREQLDIANKDSEYHELEKKRIMSMNSLQGETYESISQQMKAIQNERIELLKQLDAYRGQADLANDTISRLQGLLDEERATNAALRRRQGFAALREEKKVAVETLELEQQRTAQVLNEEEKKRQDLSRQIQGLHGDVQGLLAAPETAQKNTKTAVEDAEAEKSERERVQSKVGYLEDQVRAMEELVAEFQAAANRAISPASATPATNGVSGIDSPQGYFPTQNGVPGYPQTAAASLEGNDSIHSLMQAKIPATPPTVSPTDMPGSPQPGAQSPGFRTIHGQHRPDGSLGGYRSSRVVRRENSEDLYNSSRRRASRRAASTSTESTHSK
ncbi:ankyrin [Teratosphaeria nubilosa]|uniref:Ankyrin n=1 Tax=Teratosphaeria nubilosa TaxID=161662 RepID=A0A6G1L8D4_9PEZI|nr:ankyrin [Teratosphaeria nubilosa]